MSLAVRLALTGDLEGFARRTDAAFVAAVRNAAERQGKRAQLALREDVREGGLGDKVANTWRLKIFDNAGAAPAAFVWSKAPTIVQAFTQGVTIARAGGLWLAIPTDNVPAAGRRPMTPVEVEARFNQDLIIIPSGKPGTSLAFVDAVAAKNAKGFRPQTPGRKARKLVRVLMFVLVQQVHLKKRLHYPSIVAGFREEWPAAMRDQVAEALG